MKLRVSRDETDQRAICPQPSAVWARELRRSRVQWNMWVLHTPATEIQPSSCSMEWQHTGRGGLRRGSSRKPSQPPGTLAGVLRMLDKGGCDHWKLGQQETDRKKHSAQQVRGAVDGAVQGQPPGPGAVPPAPLTMVFSSLSGLVSGPSSSCHLLTPSR